MAWLFGKKKQKDSPPEYTEEEASSDQSEGYVNVSRDIPTYIPNIGDGLTYPTGGLYPRIDHVPPYPMAMSNTTPKDANLGDGAHYLSDVPFKLCKQLERNMNNDLDIDSLRISEILSFIDRIQNEKYDYNFILEEGIVAEMNSSNAE